MINEYLTAHRDLTDDKVLDDYSFPLAPRIKCVDGFSISVQATHGAYCRPRHNVGPWHMVECGYPSAKPDGLMSYAENPDHPLDTVYGYVPVDLVEQLIESHGGICPIEPKEPK